MTSPQQFGRKMGKVAGDMRNTDRRVANATGLVVKQQVQQELLQAAPRGRLNVGKKGRKVGVRYDLLDKAARVKMTGPAQLLERPTKAHRIPRDTKRGRKKKVFIPGVGVRSAVKHPGTKGKFPWAKGLAQAQPKIGPAAAKEFFAPIRSVF